MGRAMPFRLAQQGDSRMQNDLRKQQLDLLKYEKKFVLGGAAFLGTLGATAASADETLKGEAAEALSKIQDAHLALAQAVSDAHDCLHGAALEASAHLVDGGRPKNGPFIEAVKSLMGLG